MGSFVGASVGSSVGASVESLVGASVGSLLVPGRGSVGFGTGRISSGGAYAPPVACAGWSLVLSLDLLVPGSPSFSCSASSSTFGKSRLSSVSSPGASWNCSSGPASPLPMPVNLAIAMPAGQCDEPPQGVILVFIICENELRCFFSTCQPLCCIVLN